KITCTRVFFFQAEDGIRDGHVTGVQTCALPISSPFSCSPEPGWRESESKGDWATQAEGQEQLLHRQRPQEVADERAELRAGGNQIGRASCRERVWSWVVVVGGKGRRMESAEDGV